MAQFTVLDRVGNDLIVGTDTGVTGVISEALRVELGLVPDDTIGLRRLPPNFTDSEYAIVVFEPEPPIAAAKFQSKLTQVSIRHVGIKLTPWAYDRQQWRLGWNHYEREWLIQQLPPTSPD